MTTQRKDEMPDEIYVGRTPDGTAIWTGSKDVGRLIDGVKYIRADLSPPVPDDVAEALEAFKSYRGISSDAGEGYLFDKLEKHHIETLIRTALQSTLKPPVDTITIKREVLQGVRDDLKYIADGYSANPIFRIKEALASLDAVLSEGE